MYTLKLIVAQAIYSYLFFTVTTVPHTAAIAQSVPQLATGWTVRGSNPGGGEIFRTRPDRPWGPPSLLRKRYRVFPGVKAAGAWRWPPTPSSVQVMKELSYTATPPLAPCGLLQGETLTYLPLLSSSPQQSAVGSSLQMHTIAGLSNLNIARFSHASPTPFSFVTSSECYFMNSLKDWSHNSVPPFITLLALSRPIPSDPYITPSYSESLCLVGMRQRRIGFTMGSFKISSWIWLIISWVVTILGRPDEAHHRWKKSPRLNWATQFLTVAYNGACPPNVLSDWRKFPSAPRLAG